MRRGLGHERPDQRPAIYEEQKMTTQTLGMPSQQTAGLYRFISPEQAVKEIVDSVRHSQIYEQWISDVLSKARYMYNELLPPDRAPFLAAFRGQFGDDANALSNQHLMAKYANEATEAISEARDALYGTAEENSW